MTAFSIWPDDVQWRRVSPKLLWVELFSLFSGLAMFVVACAFAWLIFDFWPILLLAGFAALVTLVRAVLLPRIISSWGYAERADDLLVRHGRLVRRLSIVPYGRMQFIDVTAGPLERAFGLATVQLHTAAAASDARVPGLPPQEAARLRDRLATLGEARAEGL